MTGCFVQMWATPFVVRKAACYPEAEDIKDKKVRRLIKKIRLIRKLIC